MTARDFHASSTAGDERLCLNLFGAVTAAYRGKIVVLANKKPLAVLGYLALSDPSDETRERLAGLLWGDSEQAKAQASVRNALYEIGKALKAVGFDHFKGDKLSAWIDPALIEVDLWQVMDLAKRGQVHPLLHERDRIMESLLADLEGVDPSFQSWLQAKRQTFHDRLVASLEDALRGHTPGVPSDNAEPIARALHRLDPTHEEAVRVLNSSACGGRRPRFRIRTLREVMELARRGLRDRAVAGDAGADLEAADEPAADDRGATRIGSNARFHRKVAAGGR